MSISRHHNEWLSLVPNSGPFLSLPVLAQAFPQELDVHDAEHARRLRLAFEEWDQNQLSKRPDPAMHRAWIKFVLTETLGYGELLADGQEIPQTLKSEVAEYGETLRPDWIVNDPVTKKARLLVQVYPRSQSLTKPVAASRWKVSPDTRMMQLLHDTGIRLGAVTNGDHWMLVNAPKNETTGYASWYANLWLEEPLTLRAFRTLLCADRFFSVTENESLEALLDKSANDQQEVTDQLGYQVRKAVEVLIQALDKADQDHGRKLLADIEEKVLYEAALTVMMRLVFLFCAEERELLLLGDEIYDRNYAVSTLREQLRITADQFGEEILGLRFDAWARLVTTFRAVYAGVKHDRFKLPAYGGSLFNPDRFAFLEGRLTGTSWKTTEATPLPVSNRTVLHLLEALQILRVRLPGGGAAEARRLSFRSLDIEQIGHVYEGLLDHTAKRATEPMLGLQGTRDKEPEVALAELERLKANGEKELLKFLKDATGRSESALKKALNAKLDDQNAMRFRTACQNLDFWERVEPFAALVRFDDLNYPVVVLPGSVFVAAGTDRRSSGTHYTPKSLTEPIVQYTLEPLVYVGLAEGLPKEEWKLRSAKELLELKICDMACGSGAFLVQACRYMATRLLEAWDAVQMANPGTIRITPDGELSTGRSNEQLLPDDSDERQTYALRIVAQRCLYGVDKNPLAAEMAKLSLWLLTLSKGKPFEFLDHTIRCGDSLIGIHNLEQLKKFDLRGGSGIELPTANITLQFMDQRVQEAISLRRQITQILANTVEDTESQELLLLEANDKIDRLKCAADVLLSSELVLGNASDKLAVMDDAAITVAAHFNDSDLSEFRREAQKLLSGKAVFHWPLEFPEVVVEREGFDAFMGNPPFMGGRYISGTFGQPFLIYLKSRIANNVPGNSDIVAYFYLRASSLLRSSGTAGFVGTKTIAEGDTLEVGLAQIASMGAAIYSAATSQKWPGAASVLYVRLHWRKSGWTGIRILDEQVVLHISPQLDAMDTRTTHPLHQEVIPYQGCYVHGMGFILTVEQMQILIAEEASSRDCIYQCLTGDEFNNSSSFLGNRHIIYLADKSEAEARQYPAVWRFLEENVKPERLNHVGTLSKYWWRFKRPTIPLYQAIWKDPMVLVAPVVTKYLSFAWLPSRLILLNKMYAFINATMKHFVVLQSSIYDCWARQWSARLGETLQFAPTDCFSNFVFPALRILESSLGDDYCNIRAEIMSRRNEGLTRVYNLFHDPKEFSTDIRRLRELHVEMDNAVTSAYAWNELCLGHDFHETKQGVRYTISDSARREVLARLLKLNHERHAEEVCRGLHDKKKPKPKKATGPFQAAVVDPVFPKTVRDRLLCGLLMDLVLRESDLDATAYHDGLTLATSVDSCEKLLVGFDRDSFRSSKASVASELFDGNGEVPWRNLQDVLSANRGLRVDELMGSKTIGLGARFEAVRNLYPVIDSKFVDCVCKAARRLREIQASVAPTVAERELVDEVRQTDENHLATSTQG